MTDRRVHHVGHAEHVRREDVLPLLAGDLLDRAEGRDAWRTPPRRGPPSRRRRLRPLRDTTPRPRRRAPRGPLPRLFDGLLQPVGPARCHADPSALPSHLERARFPESRARAEHEHASSFQSHPIEILRRRFHGGATRYRTGRAQLDVQQASRAPRSSSRSVRLARSRPAGSRSRARTRRSPSPADSSRA